MILVMRLHLIKFIARSLWDTIGKQSTEKMKHYYKGMVESLPARSDKELHKLYKIWCNKC